MNKTTAAVIMGLVAIGVSQITANTAYFTGIVTYVSVDGQPSQPFKAGDSFAAKIIFNPLPPYAITRCVLSVDESDIVYRTSSDRSAAHFAHNVDPAQGSIYYQVADSPNFSITAQALTPSGAVPACIAEFAQADFAITLGGNDFGQRFNLAGALTSVPIIRAGN